MSEDVQRASDLLDFLTSEDDQTGSWTRGDPDTALIQSINRFGWDVFLPGGETHRVVLAYEGNRYIGRCDCEYYLKWRDHDSYPCAHLCALYRAFDDRVRDADDNLVELPLCRRSTTAAVLARQPLREPPPSPRSSLTVAKSSSTPPAKMAAHSADRRADCDRRHARGSARGHRSHDGGGGFIHTANRRAICVLRPYETGVRIACLV